MFAERLANWISSNWRLFSSKCNAYLWKSILEVGLTFFVFKELTFTLFSSTHFWGGRAACSKGKLILDSPTALSSILLLLRKIPWPKQAVSITMWNNRTSNSEILKQQKRTWEGNLTYLVVQTGQWEVCILLRLGFGKCYLFVFILHYNTVLIIFFHSDILGIRKEYDKLSGNITDPCQRNWQELLKAEFCWPSCPWVMIVSWKPGNYKNRVWEMWIYARVPRINLEV